MEAGQPKKWAAWFSSSLPWLLSGISSACFVFMLLGSCGVSRSDMLKDENLSNQCKMRLECMYMCQKNQSCVAACQQSRSCDKVENEIFCMNRYPLPTKFELADNLRPEQIEKLKAAEIAIVETARGHCRERLD